MTDVLPTITIAIDDRVVLYNLCFNGTCITVETTLKVTIHLSPHGLFAALSSIS